MLLEPFLHYPGIKCSHSVALNISMLPKYSRNWFYPSLGWILIPLLLMCITSVSWSKGTSFSQDWCKEVLRQSEPSLASVRLLRWVIHLLLTSSYHWCTYQTISHYLGCSCYLSFICCIGFFLCVCVCVCLSLPILGKQQFCTHPMERSAFSVLAFHELMISPIACFLTYLNFFCNGIIYHRSRNSQLPLTVFSHKGEKASSWLGTAEWIVEGKRTLGMEVSSWSSEEREIWLKKAKNWKLGRNGKEEPLQKQVSGVDL